MHYPALTSLIAHKVAEHSRTKFYSIACSGAYGGYVESSPPPPPPLSTTPPLLLQGHANWIHWFINYSALPLEITSNNCRMFQPHVGHMVEMDVFLTS